MITVYFRSIVILHWFEFSMMVSTLLSEMPRTFHWIQSSILFASFVSRVASRLVIDKHRKKMIYQIDDMMFLNSRNITISRSSKKLNDKMLELFKILIKIKHAYQLKLSLTMKIHSKFTSNLLQLNSKNSLNEQWNKLSDSIVIDDEDEWKMKNILNFRHYEQDKQLQYHVNWKEYDVDLHWYNVDESEFEECQKIVNDFHEQYSNKSR